jgi:glutamate formiminotransferase
VTLLAIPNFSEGRNRDTIATIGVALSRHATVLDIHSDGDHNRTVFTLTGTAPGLVDALVAGAGAAADAIDIFTHEGAHPHVGSLDVAPLVFTEPAEHGRAAAAALLTADRIAAEHGIPVFLYGSLADHRVTRAALRRGGPAALTSAMAARELIPDFGPRAPHPRAGATLVAARPPLIAFNLELAAPATVADAREIAAEIRRLPGVRALGIELGGGVAQVSTNLEQPELTSPAAVLSAVARHARVATAELVGLPPARFFADFPADLAIRHRRMLEDALLS